MNYSVLLPKFTRSSCLVFSVLMFWYIPQNIKWKSTCQYTTSEMTSADAEPLTCWHLSWQVYHLFLTCTTTEPAVGPGPWRHTSSIYCQSPCHLRSMVSVRLWGTSLIILSVSQNTSPTHWIKQEFRHFISLDNKFWQKWKHFLCFYSFHYIFLISRIKTNTSTKFSYKTTISISQCDTKFLSFFSPWCQTHWNIAMKQDH